MRIIVLDALFGKNCNNIYSRRISTLSALHKITIQRNLFLFRSIWRHAVKCFVISDSTLPKGQRWHWNKIAVVDYRQNSWLCPINWVIVPFNLLPHNRHHFLLRTIDDSHTWIMSIALANAIDTGEVPLTVMYPSTFTASTRQCHSILLFSPIP